MNRTLIQKPDIKALRKLGFSCVDMHYHTTHSDGSAKIGDILDKARKMEIGIAITDHNEISGAVEAMKYSNVLVIPGIEVNCAEGPDIILYFYNLKDLEDFFNKHVKNYRNKDLYGRTKIPFKEIITKAKKYKCVIAAPHPCGSAWKDLKTFLQNTNLNYLLKDIQALEMINGEQFMKNNLKAIEWNQKLKKGISGGSDGHCLFELGSIVTCSKASTVKDFLDSIIKRKTDVIGKKFFLPYYILPGLVSLKNHLRFGIPWFAFKKRGW